MKPRRQSTLLTAEDQSVMGHALVRIHRRWGNCGTVMSSSILADFRDAELMLQLTTERGPPAWRIFYRHKYSFENYGKFVLDQYR